MEPKTLTTVKQLKIGDRFYKVSDPKRVVYERVKAAVKRTRYRFYNCWGKTDTSNALQAFDGSTRVIFLRHNKPVKA